MSADTIDAVFGMFTTIDAVGTDPEAAFERLASGT